MAFKEGALANPSSGLPLAAVRNLIGDVREQPPHETVLLGGARVVDEIELRPDRRGLDSLDELGAIVRGDGARQPHPTRPKALQTAACARQ